MSSPRADLARALRAALPGWIVIPYPTPPAAPTAPTLVLFQTAVKAHTTAVLAVEVTVWLFVPGDPSPAFEDTLEERLLDLLGALDDVPWIETPNAEREELDNLSGYRITATSYHRKASS